MAPSQPTHTTQTTEVKLPAWVDAASQSNYKLAQDIAAKPYNPYTGQTVAGQDALTTQANNMISTGSANNQTGYNQASALSNAAGKGILSLNRDDYMNPFQNDVINSTVTSSQDALKQALAGNADKAVAAKAFGGSRGAIVDGVTTAQNNKDLMAQIAGLNTTNYNQATNAMQGDITSKLAAASQLTGNQDSANKASSAQIGGLLSAGQANQAQQQNVLNDAQNKFNDAKNYDTDRLNLMLSALGMSPYGKTDSTTKDTTQGSSGTDIAQMGMGVLSLLPTLFALSDKRTKKNIKKVGKSQSTGISIHEYNYKGEKPGTPKHRGPMAQDVEKLLPDAVANIGGVKMVDKNVHGVLSRGY
jgi:hypothetical protein